MNILVIPTWYPSGKDKLMGNYHKEFCEALAQRKGIHVNMLFIERERLNNPIKYLLMPKSDVIKENGYKTYIKRMLNVEPINFAWQLKKYVKVLDKAFREYLKENPKPDIIHAMVTLPAGYAACKIGEKYKIPVVVTEHSSYFKRFFEGINKEYGTYVLNHSKFTTVSNFMARDMKKYTSDCEVLPNVVSTTIFEKERKKIKGLKLVTVSALRQGKRIDDIIAALKMLIEGNNELNPKLTIVGDGFLEDYYKEKCHELGMDNYVDFVGRKTKEQIAQILLENNILSFQLNDMNHSVNLQTKEFLRENDEYAFLLDIENQKSQITLKKEQYNLQVLVEYANLLTNKNEIQLSYFIETDDHENVLTIELEEGREK